MNRWALKAGLPFVAFSLLANAALAGGIERGGYDIDQLFDTSRYTFESGVTYVMPDRKLKNAKDVNPADGDLNGRSHTAKGSSNYATPYIGFKVGVTDNVDCLADYSEPFGARSNPGLNWAGAQYAVTEKIYSHNYGLTCSYKFDVGPGQFRLIGGGFYQEVGGYKEELVFPFVASPAFPYDGTGRLDLAGHGWGWRTGLAYEIPEYAMRASLVYNSQVKYDNLAGTVDLTQLPGGSLVPVYGSATAPDSLELKLQSGIAPDWLAFGSVKWTNWSVLQSIPFCPKASRGLIACTAGGAAELTSLDLLYRDGWTVTGGVGHKFNDQWSGAVSLTWDRGTSQDYGIGTDTWTLGAGVAYSPTKNLEFKFAGALALMTSGHSKTVTSNGVTYGDDVTYSFGNDLAAALSTSMKIKF